MNRKPKLAFFSPFRPQPSGIADYSEELLPHLSRLADLDLISGPVEPANPCGLPVRTPAEFMLDRGRYDAAIYQVGNNVHHHGYMTPCMARVPGILVLHDLCLQYLVLGLTASAGDFGGLVEALRPLYGRRAAGLAARLLFNAADPNRYSFAAPFIRMSKAVIVHSRAAYDRVRQVSLEIPMRIVPMGVPLDERRTPAAELGRRFGIREGEFVLSSISTLARTKRLDLTLRAVAAARREAPSLRFLIAGGGNLGDEVRRMIHELGLADAVVLTGWLSDEDYRGVIAMSDAIADLRYPSNDETSASLSRAIAAGKPLIASAQGAFLELPDAFTIKAPPGEAGVEFVGRAISALVADAARRERMGRAALEFAAANLRLEDAAARYAAFAQEVAAMPDPPAHAWPSRPAPAFIRGPAGAVYRATRVGYLYRNYGWKDTLRRIREELRSASPAREAV